MNSVPQMDFTDLFEELKADLPIEASPTKRFKMTNPQAALAGNYE